MTGRVLFQDVVPYEAPSSLSGLRGPESGLLELPATIHWGPRRLFDLDDVNSRRSAYRAVVREGTPQQQAQLLNESLLRVEWNELILPRRCREVWESRFPDLAGWRRRR